MGFNLNGTIITQTGTDANLSGLAGVSGVNVQSSDNTTWYFVGNRRLDIAGTLNHDPETEILVFGDNPPIRTLSILGTYNYGSPIIVNGVTRYSTNLGLYFGDVSGTDNSCLLYTSDAADE